MNGAFSEIRWAGRRGRLRHGGGMGRLNFGFWMLDVGFGSHAKARRHEGGKMEGFLKAGRRDASATGGGFFEGPGAWKDAATEGGWEG